MEHMLSKAPKSTRDGSLKRAQSILVGIFMLLSIPFWESELPKYLPRQGFYLSHATEKQKPKARRQALESLRLGSWGSQCGQHHVPPWMLFVWVQGARGAPPVEFRRSCFFFFFFGWKEPMPVSSLEGKHSSKGRRRFTLYKACFFLSFLELNSWFRLLI